MPHRAAAPDRYVRRGLLFLGLALACQIETLLIPPRQDSAAWLFMGARQVHGQMPGRDLWDNKLPLIYLIGRAASATGHPRAFLWLLEATLTAAGALAVSRLAAVAPVSNRWLCDRFPTGRGSASFSTAAGALLCITSGVPSYHGGGYMTEVFAMPLAAIAVWLSWRAAERGDPSLVALTAGALWVWSVSFRLPTAVAAIAVVGLLGVQLARRRSTSVAVRFLAMQTAGGLVGTAIVFVHPLAAGYASDCVSAALLWPLDFGGHRVPGPLTPSTGGRLIDLARDLAPLAWLHVVAIASIWMAGRRRRHAAVSAGPGMSDSQPNMPPARLTAEGGCAPTEVVGVWYAGALASTALGWVSYAHYQYVVLAPIAAACGLSFAASVSRRSRHVIWIILAVAAVYVAGDNARRIGRSFRDESAADRRSVVDFLHRRTAPDEAVLVWAWSGSADLLPALDRPPGIRHYLAHAYFDMDLALFDAFADEFTSSPPTWLVEDDRLSRPSLTGPLRHSWESSIASLQGVQQFARERYVFVERFGRYRVLALHHATATRRAGD